MSDFYITICGNIAINVPASPKYLSTYVLLEQEDWFEKEIRFLRRLLRPGMRAIDIGASFGIYSLTIAKAVGHDGFVTAFEPTSSVGAMLCRSIVRNRFGNLTFVGMAVSAEEGEVSLNTHENSELNSISVAGDQGSLSQQLVQVTTLDRQQLLRDWNNIDFVKIDVEGEELNVVRGGKNFFSTQSPLVMFEIVDGRQARNVQEIASKFQNLKYDLYRLIGPDELLVPCQFYAPQIEFEYNLFACKSERAESLERLGLLATSVEVDVERRLGDGERLCRLQAYSPSFRLSELEEGIYRRGLDAYAVWRDINSRPSVRYTGLRTALAEFQRAVRERRTLSRLSSLARCAIDASERIVAIEALNQLLNGLMADRDGLDEAFFPPSRRYESIDPGNDCRTWILAATVEAAELLSAPTGYFEVDNPNMRKLRDWLDGTKFACPEMQRRSQLLRIRSGEQQNLLPTSLLNQPALDNLNAELWRTGFVVQ